MTAQNVSLRFTGVNSSLALKAPVRCATTGPITLSGLQTIDGVTFLQSDVAFPNSGTNKRVLVKNQTDQTQNGIYDVNTAAWTRSADFDSNDDCVQGTRVQVAQGTYNQGIWILTTADPVFITNSGSGVSNITFTQQGLILAAIGTISSVAGVSVLLATPGNPNTVITTTAYANAGDLGGGMFVWSASNHATDVTNDPQHGIFVPPPGDPTGASGAWVRQYIGPVSVRWFGAQGDGSTDDTTAIQAAINFATVSTTDAKQIGVLFPAGTYNVSSTLVINQNNWRNSFVSDGGASIVWVGTDTATDVIRIYNAYYPRFENLSIKGLTLQTLVRMVGDVFSHARPDGAGARNATFHHCNFVNGKFHLRWTCIDNDQNNEQGHAQHCLFITPGLAAISVEHMNSLWHRFDNCEFQLNAGQWVLNNANDQSGNSYPNFPANDTHLGGSGICLRDCNVVGGGWLRLGPGLHPIEIDCGRSESMRDFIYTPTNRATFHGDLNGTTTVSNVTNIGQLSVGDPFYNQWTPPGTTITAINIGLNQITLLNAATHTETASICDAGLTPFGGGMWVYLSNCWMDVWSSSNKTVNPIMVCDIRSGLGSGGRNSFEFIVENCKFNTSNRADLGMHIVGYAAGGRNNSSGSLVAFRNVTGETSNWCVWEGQLYVEGCSEPTFYPSPGVQLNIVNRTINPGKQVFWASVDPNGGSGPLASYPLANYQVGDIGYKATPTAGDFIGWVCVTSGNPGTWKTFGAISS